MEQNQNTSNEEKDDKVAYETPILKECGTIKEITETTPGSGSDAGTWS
ncbi:MAG: hypothetical protein SVY10_08330 [Thermodesulfobacteriota bacterium]|nr:hypothetical protein [Thermodesulfobacteriota bacterium]